MITFFPNGIIWFVKKIAVIICDIPKLTQMISKIFKTRPASLIHRNIVPNPWRIPELPGPI